MDSDEEDIYADIDDGSSFGDVHSSDEFNALRAKADSLAKENAKLSRQNEILTRNISCLYRTAVMEIERKENEIKTLREKLEQLEHPSKGKERIYHHHHHR